MSKNTVKRLVIIIVIAIVIALTLALVDMNLCIRNLEPKFCIKVNTHENNNTTSYVGFLYKIYRYNTNDKDNYHVKIGTWFLMYDPDLNVITN